MKHDDIDLSPIRSQRLDLVPLSRDFMEAIVAGDRERAQKLVEFALPVDFPDEDALGLLTLRRMQVERDPGRAPWSLRAIVLRDARQMVGYTNFHGPPGVNDTATPGAAEVGYTVFPAHRGAGFATEVARAMIDWARSRHGVRHFISGVAPGNLPSRRINEKLGFVSTGQIVDGEEIFELRFA
ncbi:MAG: GNAT family N-acetyltransferase [bacterium]